MSGGHWDYEQERFNSFLDSIDEENDSYSNTVLREAIEQMPELHSKMMEVAKLFYEYLHDLDWHICSDTEIDNFSKYQKKMLKKLEKIIK